MPSSRTCQPRNMPRARQRNNSCEVTSRECSRAHATQACRRRYSRARILSPHRFGAPPTDTRPPRIGAACRTVSLCSSCSTRFITAGSCRHICGRWGLRDPRSMDHRPTNRRREARSSTARKVATRTPPDREARHANVDRVVLPYRLTFVANDDPFTASELMEKTMVLHGDFVGGSYDATLPVACGRVDAVN